MIYGLGDKLPTVLSQHGYEIIIIVRETIHLYIVMKTQVTYRLINTLSPGEFSS